MNISLDSINYLGEDKIYIKDNIIFPKEYYSNTEIIDLKDVKVDGCIYKNLSEEIVLDVFVSGVMILKDSISLENINYNFSTNIEEILENVENSIDILPILWQNIVLEVPLKVTEVKDFSNYCGDGWKLISEEEVKSNNPFQSLKEKFKEE